MICPDCGNTAQAGKAGGAFWFHRKQNKDAPRGFCTILQVTAWRCSDCGWTGLNDPSLVRLIKPRNSEDSGASAVTFSFDGSCPVCRRDVEQGYVLGELSFFADDRPRRSIWRQLLAPSPRVGAKAKAQRCLRCRWLGVEGNSFVRPGDSPVEEDGITIYQA